MKEAGLGKITWGYIWRAFLWMLAISLVFTTIWSMISGIDNVSNYSELMGSYKIYIIGMVILNALGVFLSCKWATKGIRKKFVINENNKPQVVKAISIVLIVAAIINGIYGINQTAAIEEAIDDIEKAMSGYNALSSITGVDNETKDIAYEINEFVDFIEFMTPVVVVINAASFIVMIPFEKKFLNKENEVKAK